MAFTTGAIIENEVAYNAAIKRNILQNAMKTWRANTERHNEIEDALYAGRIYDDYGRITGYVEGFMGSMASAFDKYGKLTPNQSAAVLKGIDARAARKAEWADKQAVLNASRKFLGEIGKKLEVELTVKKVIKIEGASFSYYDSGISYLFIMEDADSNVVVYKGRSGVFMELEEGATIRLQATVKDHGVRNDVKQTIIQRPKII